MDPMNLYCGNGVIIWKEQKIFKRNMLILKKKDTIVYRNQLERNNTDYGKYT